MLGRPGRGTEKQDGGGIVEGTEFKPTSKDSKQWLYMDIHISHIGGRDNNKLDIYIGIEAFALLEEHCIIRKQRPPLYSACSHHNPHHQLSPATPQVHHQARETINCDEAALKYGGVVVAEYRAKKPPVVPKYDGFVTAEHHAKKPPAVSAPPAPTLRYFH
ncbi:hypothetical protein GH714_023002 [Hevea brasiliensis]|uniref:Uncharacterized protein n=1 Tax=Hevea brasiliensis TaxID=3981 RepID=A0A6A6NIW8_HEVBR|nr:hypothetical protein GH714_023002 [Hevea brasiliensis]